MDYGGRAKYLVVGAPWNTIVTGGTTPITVKITSEEKVTTPAGTFDALVLTYKLNDNTSKIYVVKDLPMPVKAETYDINDQIYYKYELVSLTR
jgi:outer membrane lipoprotein-sorting protein